MWANNIVTHLQVKDHPLVYAIRAPGEIFILVSSLWLLYREWFGGRRNQRLIY
jgi:hypothetical protein